MTEAERIAGEIVEAIERLNLAATVMPYDSDQDRREAWREVITPILTAHESDALIRERQQRERAEQDTSAVRAERDAELLKMNEETSMYHEKYIGALAEARALQLGFADAQTRAKAAEAKLAEMADTRCTWVDCEERAEHPQVATDGEVWANLCAKHAKDLAESITEQNIPRLLSNWTKAGGGAKKMAERM